MTTPMTTTTTQFTRMSIIQKLAEAAAEAAEIHIEKVCEDNEHLLAEIKSLKDQVAKLQSEKERQRKRNEQLGDLFADLITDNSEKDDRIKLLEDQVANL